MVFAACHSGGGVSPEVDASPDGPPVDTDASPSGRGLWVTWRADPALPGMTIYRPRELSAFGGDRRLPILLWGNGAGANTTQEHKNFLNESKFIFLDFCSEN